MDSLIAHTIFNLMIVSFIEEKIGFCETVILYYGTGVIGNIFSIMMTDNPVVSSTRTNNVDIGSFSLLVLSLILEYRIFRADLYKNYENYRQPIKLSLYKGAIYCFLAYHYTAYEDLANFYISRRYHCCPHGTNSYVHKHNFFGGAGQVFAPTISLSIVLIYLSLYIPTIIGLQSNDTPIR
jgi:hypothetical protein